MSVHRTDERSALEAIDKLQDSGVLAGMTPLEVVGLYRLLHNLGGEFVSFGMELEVDISIKKITILVKTTMAIRTVVMNVQTCRNAPSGWQVLVAPLGNNDESLAKIVQLDSWCVKSIVSQRAAAKAKGGL